MDHGTYMEGEPLSDVTIKDIPAYEDTWHLRVEVKKRLENMGGCTLFGKRLWKLRSRHQNQNVLQLNVFRNHRHTLSSFLMCGKRFLR